MFQIPLPITPDYHILTNIRTNAAIRQIIMTYITEEEEAAIDRGEVVTLNRGNHTYSIRQNCIYCYGEVDFKSDKDLGQINNFNFLNHLGFSGVHIYSNYDYDKHICYSPKRYLLWTETWSPAQLAKMAHGYLGKPKRIVLFNFTIR
jgi:hypothetical protein